MIKPNYSTQVSYHYLLTGKTKWRDPNHVPTTPVAREGRVEKVLYQWPSRVLFIRIFNYGSCLKRFVSP